MKVKDKVFVSYKMKFKVCSTCKASKPMIEFSRNKKSKDGLQYICKNCKDRWAKEYRKTKYGLITYIYGNQRKTSRKRNHPMPNYTISELRDWILSQPNFEKLYNDWVISGNNKNLTPSCDRDDDNLPYDLSRLTLMTWEKNNHKHYSDRINGINNKTNKAVIGTHITTSETIEFYSMMDAERNGFTQPCISKCCVGKLKTHRSYYWNFK